MIGTHLSLAWRSVLARKATALLTILSVAVAVTLFLGVDKIRRGAEAGFQRTVSGTDIIVGAPTGPVNLLLSSVFRIGNPTAGIPYEAVEEIAANPAVAWTVPLSLGDSYDRYRVLGTTPGYFEHYRYGAQQPLRFTAGTGFGDVRSAVLGSEVAKTLDHALGDEIVISHGVEAVDFAAHGDAPFVVTGILAPTGTPVDRTVHVSLEGLAAVHGEIGDDHEEEHGDDHDHAFRPDQVTSLLVGTRNPTLALRLQYDLNRQTDPPLLAILPGVTLQELWSVVGAAERALSITAGFVIVTGLMSLLIAILTSLNERRREIAILRAVGAGRGTVFGLIVTEAGLLALIGGIVGNAAVYGVLAVLGPWLETQYGIPLGAVGPTAHEIGIVALVTGLAAVLGLIPAVRAYRNAGVDGLSPTL